MQPKKHNNSNDNDYSKQIDESIANAEERRKKALDEEKSLSDEELKDVSGGKSPITTMGAVIIEPPK